jgi:CDP-glucose 4,6-dehydratase
VPDCVRAIIADETIVIRKPEATRPWQHVLEPLSGYLSLAAMQYNNPKLSNSWNFGPSSDSIHNVGELTEKIIRLWGKGKLDIIRNDKIYESTLLKLDCDRALQELGWVARWNFDTTLQKTVDWYKVYAEGKIISEEQINCYMKEV